MSHASSAATPEHVQHVGQSAPVISAIGIVFGNIGTSPLYAVDQIFCGASPVTPTPGNVLGCVSLVIWSLILIVSVKYAVFVLRADSGGEGGVFALYALLHPFRSGSPAIALLLGALMLGAGLLLGDGIITPAISLLSAVEGLNVATPMFADAVVPITIALLALLFLVQHRGTAEVGRMFGPVLLVWFAVIAVLGLRQIILQPGIMLALNPLYGLDFLLTSKAHQAVLTLAALMLVVSGGEAMHADLGHFGARPLRLAWFAIVSPALMLNYLGQGALLLHQPPAEGGHLFYSLVPEAALYPMVALATIATTVAAQSLISGAFSLTTQAMALGLCPRLRVVHTHRAHAGQIYLPFVNWALFAGCVALVLGFRSSGSLAAAYGLAVSGVMVVTSVAMIAVGRLQWRWDRLTSGALFGAFTLLSTVFCAASSLKFVEGGYIPLAIGGAVLVIMRTWRWGRKATFEAYTSIPTVTMRKMVELHSSEQAYMERIALLMTPKHLASLDDRAPALLQLLHSRYGLLPRHLIFVEVAHKKVPYIHDGRYDIRVLHREAKCSAIAVTLQFGFMEEPNVEAVLEDLARHRQIDLPVHENRWIVHVSIETLLPSRKMSLLGQLRLRLFLLMRQNSQPAHYFYGLGDNVQLSAEIIPVRIK